MSLIGIVFGISFFIVTQAQTSGFQQFFTKTILGTSGAILISDRFQDLEGTVNKVSSDGSTHFVFKSREDSRFIEGVDHPDKVINSLSAFPSITGISEILVTSANLYSNSHSQSVKVHGFRIQNHIMVSDLENQLIQGSVKD
ncbi:MAG: ABC transporter permease, partial [Verrucomicrobiia bacterium]